MRVHTGNKVRKEYQSQRCMHHFFLLFLFPPNLNKNLSLKMYPLLNWLFLYTNLWNFNSHFSHSTLFSYFLNGMKKGLFLFWKKYSTFGNWISYLQRKLGWQKVITLHPLQNLFLYKSTTYSRQIIIILQSLFF